MGDPRNIEPITVSEEAAEHAIGVLVRFARQRESSVAVSTFTDDGRPLYVVAVSCETDAMDELRSTSLFNRGKKR